MIKFWLKIVVFIIVFISLMFTNSIVKADDDNTLQWNDIFTAGDNFLSTGKTAASNQTNGATDKAVQEIINELYNILLPLGIVITVIVGGVLGIKFMLASAEDKAKIKELMVPYVAGCVAIYGAFGIWKIAIEIFSAMT